MHGAPFSLYSLVVVINFKSFVSLEAQPRYGIEHSRCQPADGPFHFEHSRLSSINSVINEGFVTMGTAMRAHHGRGMRALRHILSVHRATKRRAAFNSLQQPYEPSSGYFGRFQTSPNSAAVDF
jgi:hypothetical protein